MYSEVFLVMYYSHYRRKYTIFPRKMKNGKKIQYIRIYASDGFTRITFSSGLRSKEAARAKFDALLSNPEEIKRIQDEYNRRKFIRQHPSIQTSEDPEIENFSPSTLFKDYAKNWWDWDKCFYVRAKRNRGTESHPGIKRSSVDTNRMWTARYLIPRLGDFRLKELTPEIIDVRLLNYLKEKQNLAPKTINNIRAILVTMMKAAVRQGLIERNPVELTLPFKTDKVKRELLSLDEMKQLFCWDNFESCWNNVYQYYSINLLAAYTGMRQGELRALKMADISPNSIVVRKGYTKYGEETTKTSDIRIAPIPTEMYKLLLFVSSLSPDSPYIFTVKGNLPIASSKCRLSLYDAMKAIGIDEKERKRRHITFHSLRHFFTTYCIRENISQEKIRSVTGHKSLSMIDRYTDLEARDLEDINKAQRILTDSIFVKH